MEFCGLTTENRAALLVVGGRNGAGISRVGLHPECGFRDPAGLKGLIQQKEAKILFPPPAPGLSTLSFILGVGPFLRLSFF